MRPKERFSTLPTLRNTVNQLAADLEAKVPPTVEWTAVHRRGTGALIDVCGLVCVFAACFQLLARS